MLWKKPAGLKYTDLCIYIDQHVPMVASYDGNEEQKAEIEVVGDTIYNYIWLLVKALAIKKRMFTDFKDYDGYAFYAASRLYFALLKNYKNAGQIIKGKEIRPIKSCLNYTKTLLYPMKIEYQRQTFNTILSEEFVSKKFDAFSFQENLKEQAQASQGSYVKFNELVKDTFKDFDTMLNTVVSKSPFSNNSLDYQHLKISLLLNCVYNLKHYKKLDADKPTIILWKLPKSMSAYVSILLKELYTVIKTEIMNCKAEVVLDDNLLTKLISSTGGEYRDED